jgi:SAM-dependent methyltransferase
VDCVERWRAIVERRRVQIEAAAEHAGRSGDDYWGRRAKSYRDATHGLTEDDPFPRAVLRHVTPVSSVLDVGAGTGRHTLALAPRVRRVTAVDPSPAMLSFLREGAAASKLDNVDVVEAQWPAEGVDQADVVICSHVLYPIADIIPFVRALEAAARERVFIFLRADPIATDFGFWAEFHGEPLQRQPSFLDAYCAMAQDGILADVEIVRAPFTWNFDSLEEAEQHLANSLYLRDGDEAAKARLRELLPQRFSRLPDGRWAPPVTPNRSAILSWSPPEEG